MDAGHSDSTSEQEFLQAAIAAVRQRIDAAAVAAGRDPQDVTLVAASKTVSADRLQVAIDAGLTVFGENRVQEAREKWPELLARNPQVELQIIGGLQTNKVRDAVGLVHVIQSVDRASLAEAIAREGQKQGRQPAIFVQVNTGDEDQKSGAAASDADQLIKTCREVLQLEVRGVMCIPPADLDPANDFALLREIALRNDLPGISMGMSADYVQAVSAGATHVRVGSALFGMRQPAAVMV